MIELEEGLLKPVNVILISTVLTLIVLIESLYFIPWAPYFIVYAILAIFIPVMLKSYKFGGFKEIIRDHYRELLVILIVALAFEFFMDFLLNLILISLNKVGDPYVDFNAALELLASRAGEKFGISTDDAFAIYAVYILIWAPIGEELFYRGYIYGVLKDKEGFMVAAIISSFFFGIRHITHFFFITPVPLVPGLWWAFHAFIFGLIMVYAYEKTGSLYIPIIIHFFANLIPAVI